MFRWFKNRRTVAASVQRRATQHRTCDDDVKAVLDHAVALAVFFLEGGQLPTMLPVRNGLPSFGVGINPRGELLDFNCLPNPDDPGTFSVFVLPDQLSLFASHQADSGFQEELAERNALVAPVPIHLVAGGMGQCAAQGGIHVAALVDRMELAPGNPAGKTHAIRVQIEHVEKKPLTAYQPYTLQNWKVVLGERSSGPGKPIVFG